MKTTVLIYKEVDGKRRLVQAAQEEWNEILKANQGLPMEKRRLFEKNCFDNGPELDCMYIEVSYNEYKRWHSSNEMVGRKRKTNSPYPVLSLDAPAKDTEASDYHEVVPSPCNTEKSALDKIMLEELRKALEKWRPWANDLLDLYMDGKRRESTNWLAVSCGVSQQMARRYKKDFENFLKNFFI